MGGAPGAGGWGWGVGWGGVGWGWGVLPHLLPVLRRERERDREREATGVTPPDLEEVARCPL